MDQLDDFRERVKQLLTDEHTTINRISGGDGSIQRKLHRQINEKVGVSLDTVYILQNAFPGLNTHWLLTGEGVPFPDDAARRSSQQLMKAVKASDDESVIPVYSVEASANLNTLNISESEPEIVGRVVVPNMPRCDGATYVRGDSMYPLLQSGDMIGFKIMPVSPESIFYGEIYLITLDVEGDRYLTVKYIYRSELGPEYVKLVSANSSHQPKDVHLSTVRGIALVKFTIRMNSML